MACFRPVEAFLMPDGSVSFWSRAGSVRQFHVSCGRCQGCLLERSRQWAVRCMHESQLHDRNCFLTLTYDDEHLPEGGSLVYRDFQLFLKRLRRAIAPNQVRFFMCGEYGEQLARPHYHACLFGYDFPDKVFFRRSGKNVVYRSPALEKLWPFGWSSIGSVTFQSAGYVARYCFKKVTGDPAREHYAVVDQGSGVIFDRVPEFCHMSLRPGVGAEWVRRFSSDVVPGSSVVVNGVETEVPRYYKRLLERDLSVEDFAAFEGRVKERVSRRDRMDNTARRLRVRERVTVARLRLLKREV